MENTYNPPPTGISFSDCRLFRLGVSIPPQDEEKLLAAVEESQKKLLELNNQLGSKRSQVAAAKAELDQNTQSLQEINK